MRTPATRIRWTLGVMAGVALYSLSARATQLDQLSTLNVQTTIDAAVWSSGNDIGGTTLVDDSAQIWCSSESNVAGTVQIRVVRSSQTNYIHYYWRISQVNTNFVVERLTIGNFGSGWLDAHYRPDGIGDNLVRMYGANRAPDGNIDLFFRNLTESPPRLGVYAGQSSKFALLKSFNTNYHQVTRTQSMMPPGNDRLQAVVLINGSPAVCEVGNSSTPFAPVYVPG